MMKAFARPALAGSMILSALAISTIHAQQTNIIIDGPNGMAEGDLGFSMSNGWLTSSFATGYDNSPTLWATSWDGNAIEEEVWENEVENPEDLQCAAYELTPYLSPYIKTEAEVYAWWASGSNRAQDAKYSVFHDTGIDTVTVNQTQNGGQWNLLGTYSFTDGLLVNPGRPVNQVRLYNDFTQGSVVSADAVKYSIISQTITFDDGEDNFNGSSNWFQSTSVPGYLYEGYHARATEATSDAATFSFFLEEAGDYEVRARWTSGANRSSSAPYIIYHSQGSTTVTVDQKQNGGQWVSLGTFNFNYGTNHVKLSCWTTPGEFVIADAIQLKK